MRVTVLEASDRLGGKVARHWVAGIELDAGAESFATRRDTVASLARSLGLEASVVRPNSAGAWLLATDGTAFPLPKTGLLGIPGIPLAADVIGIIGFWAALRAQLDELMPGLVASKEQNFSRLVRRRMGRAVLEQLVAPVTLGIHSRHPNDLDVDVVAPGLRAAMLSTGSLAHAVLKLRDAAPAGSAVSGIVGGMFELIEALGRDLERRGVLVRTSARVTSADANGVTLSGGERLDADRVVLATPLAPPVETPIVLATLVVEAPQLDAAPRGTGLLIAPGGTGIRAKALTHATAKWAWLAETVVEHSGEHRHVLRLSYDRVPLEQLQERARQDAERLLGVTLTPSSVVGFAHVEWSLPASKPEPIDGVTVVGESVAGIGIAAVIAHANREAERLLQEVEA